MEKLHLKMLALMLLISITATSQITPEGKRNYTLKEFTSNKKDFRESRYKSDYFVNIKFSESLNIEQQTKLAEAGIVLIQPSGEHEYLVSCNKGVKASTLESLGAKEIIRKISQLKLSNDVLLKDIPTWAQKGNDRAKVSVVFNQKVSPYEIQTILEEYDADIAPNENFQGFIQLAELYIDQLEDLAKHPLVTYIDFLQEPDQKLNYENRIISKVNTIQNIIPGNLNLKGEDVCIGIGDGGELGKHNDFSPRAINKANGSYSSFGAHGDHVSGIVAGNGNINPRHKGIAPNAEILVQKTSLVTYYLEDYYNQYGMVLTNNSYGTSASCTSNGTYNYTSIGLDNQLNEFDEVLHVFAAGNSGSATCGDFPKGYQTVLRYYQAAKNVLTVGNMRDNRVINNNSSRGPVMDGRLKPEIVAVGTAVMSTGRNYDYYTSTGTSMSSPLVTGVLGLMYQRYRELNSGANPTGALMKAIACNTAEDLGNPGPDFIHGFGMINAGRAVEVINQGTYYGGTLTSGSNASQEINVPINTSELKVMLYWSDVEGVLNAQKALVNDLDLSVQGPTGTMLPWVLNPAPANVADDAVRGTDRLNNIEQVTITNPVVGAYTINVSAFNIPIGAQEYWITYEFVGNKTKLTHPIGGETFEPNTFTFIDWEAPIDNTSKFKIEWSADNGGTWELVKDLVEAEVRSFKWTVPVSYTEEALVRVTKIATGEETSSVNKFKIIPGIENFSVQPGCAHSIELNWESNDTYESFKVLHLTEDGFEELEEITENTYNATGAFMPGQEYWFAVQGITATGEKGIRTIAEKAMLISGLVCSWKDDGVVYLPQHLLARVDTEDSLSNEQPITAMVFNAGSNALTSFELSYKINNNPKVTEQFNMTLASGDSTVVTFAQTADMTAEGDFQIEMWMIIPNDTHTGNDYLPPSLYARQIPNDNLAMPYNDNFDNLEKTYTSDMFAVEGFEHIDLFVGEQGEVTFGKYDNRTLMSLRPSAIWQEGVTYSKARLTYNMEEFFRSINPVLLKFDHRGHSLLNIPGWESNDNLLQVRGSDQDDWVTIQVFDYNSDWNTTPEIDISQALVDAGQNFTSSFQIQFVQDALFGLYIDNIQLSSGARLPVTWGDFNVSGNEDGQVDVDWSTISEIDNNYFEVQVAVGTNPNDGLEFKSLGYVPGQGTTDKINQYQYVDTAPNKTGIRYYRIKQVDFDGTTTYTDIRQLRFNESTTKVSAYPNPMMNDLFVHYEAQKEEDVTLQLVDLAGRVLLTQTMHFLEGNYDFPVEVANDLPAGFYSLRFVREGREPKAIRIQKILD